MAPPENTSFNSLFNSLSRELFDAVMLTVRNTQGVSTLATCLLVCKDWKKRITPLLYTDTFIDNSNIEIFSLRVTRPTCSLIKSLTVSISVRPFSEAPSARATGVSTEEREEWEKSARQGTPEAKQLWMDLRNLSEKVQYMTYLSVFSFSVSGRDTPHGFWIPRLSLASLVSSLAETCHSVEIDTKGLDRDSPQPEHLCDRLRRIIPRIEHLRLRLSTLCPHIFSPTSSDVKGAIDAPLLKTAVINLTTRRTVNMGTGLCDTSSGSMGTSDAARPSVHLTFVQYIRGLLENGGCPKVERMLLVDSRPDDYDDKSVYPALYQYDVVNNVTYSLPWYRILPFTGRLPFTDDSYLMRIYPENEVISHYWVLMALAEGEMWKSTTNGFRLPSALLQTESQKAGHILKYLPVMSTETWKEKYPRKTCHLWWNEKKTGMRLLSAERYDGLPEMPIMREYTPAGWIRDGTDLEPDKPDKES